MEALGSLVKHVDIVVPEKKLEEIYFFVHIPNSSHTAIIIIAEKALPR